MTCIAYCDESGTSANSRCYSIGVITVPESEQDTFEEWIANLKTGHGVNDELKWHKIRKGHGAINCALDLLYGIAKSQSWTYDAIVVHKELYINWQGNAQQLETAFYKTYIQLLRHVASRTKGATKVLIDNRVDSYRKQHEVVETIGNRMLTRLESKGRLESVQKVDSKQNPGIQAVDIITGAVNSAHQRFVTPDLKMHNGKHVAIERLACLLGWDDLCYDTWPDPRINIWHFPIQYRAVPATKRYTVAGNVPYVAASDLE